MAKTHYTERISYYDTPAAKQRLSIEAELQSVKPQELLRSIVSKRLTELANKRKRTKSSHGKTSTTRA